MGVMSKHRFEIPTDLSDPNDNNSHFVNFLLNNHHNTAVLLNHYSGG